MGGGGVVFQLGRRGFICNGGVPNGGMGFDREVFKKNQGMGVAPLHDPTPSIRGNPGKLVREVNLF